MRYEGRQRFPPRRQDSGRPDSGRQRDDTLSTRYDRPRAKDRPQPGGTTAPKHTGGAPVTRYKAGVHAVAAADEVDAHNEEPAHEEFLEPDSGEDAESQGSVELALNLSV